MTQNPIAAKEPADPAKGNDLLDQIPQWLKSLYQMENELRRAARNGLVLRNDQATEHLAAARRHLDAAM
jgi:hypothetical protein